MFGSQLDVVMLSSMTQDLAPFFFRCDQECDMTNIFAASIVLLFTFTIFAIQVHLAREHESLRTFIVRNKLRNDIYYLLYQMRMLQPVVFEKRLITEQDKHQITSIAKTIKHIDDGLKEMEGKITEEEQKKIDETITNVTRRLKHGVNDLKRIPPRFDYMDFSESIKDISCTLPLVA